MKVFTSIVLLLGFPLATTRVHAQEAKVEKKQASVEELADQLYTLVMSPGKLSLTVTDHASLDAALAKLEENKKKITAIAEELKLHPQPSLERREVIDKEMNRREKAVDKDTVKMIE